MSLHKVSSSINITALGRENTVDDLRMMFGTREGKQVVQQPGVSAMTRSLSRNLSTLSISSSTKGGRTKKAKTEDSINLESLKEIKKMFDNATGEDCDGLEQDVFVEKFRDILGANMTDRELTFLFMKIDANSDGSVDWDEFSNFMLLENEGAAALGDGKAFRKFASQDAAIGLSQQYHHHRELISRIVCANKMNSYITASRDGTFKVWTNRLQFVKEVKMVDRGRPSVRRRALDAGETPLPELRQSSKRNDVNLSGIPHSQRKTIPAWITDIVYLPFCNRLCVATMDRLITFYDTATWEPTFYVRKLPCAPLSLHFYGNAESNMLVIGDDGGGIQYFKNWNEYYGMRDSVNEDQRHYVDGSDYPRYKLHSDWISRVKFVPDMNSIITSSLDSTIVVFDLGKKAEERRLAGHTKGVYSFAYCTECKVLATCGLERVIQLWNPYIAKPMSQLQGHTASVTDIVATCENSRTKSEGHYFISLAADKVIKVWDAQTYRCVQTICDKIKRMPEDRLSSIVYDEKTMRIVTGAGGLQVWPRDGMQNVNADAEEVRAAYHHHQLCAALYNKNFDQVVSADHGSTVCVWKIETGELAFRFNKAHGEAIITSIAFDQGGRRLVTGAGDGTLKVWNFNNGACIKDLLPWEEPEENNNISDDELYGFNGRKRFLIREETDPFDEAPPPRRPWRDSPLDSIGYRAKSNEGKEVTSVLYVHDGKEGDGDDTSTRVFVSVGWDRKISVWEDSESPEEPCQRHFYGSHDADITDAAFNPPHTIATVSADGVIKIWNAESGRLQFGGQVPDSVPTAARSLEKVLFHSPFNNLVVTCGGDGCLRYWLLEDTKIIHLGAVNSGHPRGEMVQSIAISEAGDFTVTADTSGCVKLWNSSRVHPKLSVMSTALVPCGMWRAHLKAIVSVDWVNKYQMILTASVDRTVALWSVKGEYVGTFGQSPPWDLTRPSTWDHSFEPLPLPKPLTFVGQISDNVPDYLKALRSVAVGGGAALGGKSVPLPPTSSSRADLGDKDDDDDSSDILPSLARLKARRIALDPGYPHNSIRSQARQLNFHMLKVPTWTRLAKPEVKTSARAPRESGTLLHPLGGGTDTGPSILSPRDIGIAPPGSRNRNSLRKGSTPRLHVHLATSPSRRDSVRSLKNGISPRTRRVRAISNSRRIGPGT